MLVKRRACALLGIGFLAVGFVAERAWTQENVLVLVADDVGVDRVGCYAEHPNPGSTPNIDQLAARGVLFRNAWSNPICSPTRAALLTGRHGFRTGIGGLVNYAAGQGLPLAEWTLPELLDAGTHGLWDHAAIGKWHLGTSNTGPLHPLLSGFRRHRGALGNLGTNAAPGNYFAYVKAVEGQLAASRVYATTDTVDDALEVIDAMSEPWFVYLCFNASHKPYHVPPAALYGGQITDPSQTTDVKYMKVLTEAMDTEIGRLLHELAPGMLARTNVIFLGDNGTDGGATTAPFNSAHAKGTVYEGGVNVPFIVAGPRVKQPGSECAALVQVTDIFATVAQIAAVRPASVLPPGTTLDSISLLPYLADPSRASLRTHAFTESFSPNGTGTPDEVERALRDQRHKLVRHQSSVFGPSGRVIVTVEELYDLAADPFEAHNLLAPSPPAAASPHRTEVTR